MALLDLNHSVGRLSGFGNFKEGGRGGVISDVAISIITVLCFNLIRLESSKWPVLPRGRVTELEGIRENFRVISEPLMVKRYHEYFGSGFIILVIRFLIWHGNSFLHFRGYCSLPL